MKTKKVCIVTGGISGLGLAAIKFLLAKDIFIIATTSSKDFFLQQTNLSHKNLKVIPITCFEDKSIAVFVNNVVNEYGQIDMLINNEGDEACNAVAAISYSKLAITMAKHVLPVMKNASCGHVFFVSFLPTAKHENQKLVEEFIATCKAETGCVNIQFTVIEQSKTSIL